MYIGICIVYIYIVLQEAYTNMQYNYTDIKICTNRILFKISVEVLLEDIRTHPVVKFYELKICAYTIFP